MTPLRTLWNKLWSAVSLIVPRPEGQSCANCRHFADHSNPDDDPEECNGYCCEEVDRLGMEEAVRQNPYGGHWTHSDAWCPQWQGGETLWPKSE